jgi:quercetin dioxygenase-like cupin family protein
MKIDNINNMFKGWFIGNFEPTLFKTDEFEVAVKDYKAGEKEESHYHKIATEYTVIAFGKVRMNGIEYNKGDIIIMEPEESTDFEALEDCSTVVVKVPCSKNDKYTI